MRILSVEYLSLNKKYQFMGVVFASFFSSTITGILSSVLRGILFVLKYLFLDWITISNTDADSNRVYDWYMYFLNTEKKKGKLYTPSIAIETAASINKMWYNPEKYDKVQIRLLPSSWSILWYNKLPIIIYISWKTSGIKYDFRGNSSAGVTITLYRLRLTRKDFWKKFTEYTQTMYNSKITKYQRIYKWEFRGWNSPILSPMYKLDTGIFVLTPAMQRIVSNIKIFLDKKTREKYKKHGFDYNRKICAYGPPGTGKSKLIVRIAGEYNLPLYYYSSVSNIRCMFDKVQFGIIVIEEMDRCISYTEDREVEEEVRKGFINKGHPSVTEWHDVLDKILGDKIIIYMTTNNLDILQKINHGSIVRPERVDQIEYIGYMTKSDIEKLLFKYFNRKIDIDIPKETKLTPADIINIIKGSNDDIKVVQKLIRDRNMSNTK
jgi:hypothetical protein